MKYAKSTVQSKPKGYEQIRYNWRDETYRYEVRWHTRIPGAPPEQGNTWVVERITPGHDGVGRKYEYMIGEDEWVSRKVWQDTVEAWQKGLATPEQIEILEKGHWKE